jgi:hypothetical protein
MRVELQASFTEVEWSDKVSFGLFEQATLEFEIIPCIVSFSKTRKNYNIAFIFLV